MKEAIAMKSLLEGQGHGSGDELDELVKATVMSLEEEKDGAGEKLKKTKSMQKTHGGGEGGR